MIFSYVSGDPALDLAGTLGHRRDIPVDALTTPADLERWVAACPGLPDRVTAGPADLTAARELREAVYTLALDRVRARGFDPGALAVLNEVAAGPVPAIALGDAGLSVAGDLTAVLTHLARGAAAVLADAGVRLKECGRATCTRVYVDRSRGARRTWCGMDECGNRVKAAAYRARKRAAADRGRVGPSRA